MTSTNYGELNVRPRRYRGIRSSKKSILYSDYNTEEEQKNDSLGQRSISLTTLPNNRGNLVSNTTSPAPIPGPFLEPRMAQLETLEAKMASIEVSLSTAQRRKNGKKIGSGIVNNSNKSSLLRDNLPASIFASIRSNTLIDTCRELELLRNALKDKENTIQNLQGQINCCGSLASIQPLDPTERRIAELRLQSLKQEEESKKAAIKKINLMLEQIDADEANIDVRIKQAELEYELGREELGLLAIREELRTLSSRMDVKTALTLYSSIDSSSKYTLHCIQSEYDPKSPRFGAGNIENKVGLFILWAAENSGLQKGDRILEINGKITLSTSKEEMNRLLTVCPSKAEIVVLRVWIPSSVEEFLRRENLRLTHRISYLEDQVSELLLNKTKPSMPFQVSKNDEKQTEIFQKGSQVALLSSDSKKSNKLSFDNYKNLAVATPSNDLSQNSHINGKELKANNIFSGVNSHHISNASNHNNQGHESSMSNLSFSSRKGIKNLAKKYDKEESTSFIKDKWNNEIKEDCFKKHVSALVNPKNNSVFEDSCFLSDLEWQKKKYNYHHGRIIDYSSETSCPKYKSLKDKKFETDEESVYHIKSDQSEPENGRCKPMPPKKPIRLSINRATSLQNVEKGYSVQNSVRKIRRSHKGEAPPPPVIQNE